MRRVISMLMDVRTALITGASSGIGAALAEALARPGTTLHLSGRDQVGLDALAAKCSQRGANVFPRMLDVRDNNAMAAWIAAAGPLDLVVANAGISGRSRDGGPEYSERTREIFETNVGGVLNTVLPALEAMPTQSAGAEGVRGRIVVVASIAAFLAAPDSAAYCASKAAVDGWTVASAPSARQRGVILTSVWMGLAARTAGLLPPRVLAAVTRRHRSADGS